MVNLVVIYYCFTSIKNELVISLNQLDCMVDDPSGKITTLTIKSLLMDIDIYHN